MSETTKVTIEYRYALWGTRVYWLWVRGEYAELCSVRGVKTLLTDLRLQAGKRVDAACREARETGRAEVEI